MSIARAALFDLDRTLVRVETASLYVKYTREIGETTWRDDLQVGWWVLQYTLGALDAQAVAEQAFATMKGVPETVLAARCDDWFNRYVERHICDRGRQAVAYHHDRGDILAIVTGASPYVARPLAQRLNIPHVVATELEVIDHTLTGRPVYPLCYAHGKIERAQKLADSLGFRLEDATFYSDSFTDLPLLEAVREPVVVNPDPRLKREAARRKWRVERW
ncbi:MAG: HAD family hydrolase [Polyangiaceae bacterium]